MHHNHVNTHNRFYEEHGDLDNARVILNKATLADFRVRPTMLVLIGLVCLSLAVVVVKTSQQPSLQSKLIPSPIPKQSPEDLAAVYCGWAEMELRHEEYDKALQVMQHAVTEPSQAIQRRRQAEAQGRALAGLKGGKQQQEMQAAIPVQVGLVGFVVFGVGDVIWVGGRTD